MAKKRKEAPQIETERLILRRKQDEDILFLVKMLNDDEVREFLGGYPPRDERSCIGMIRHRRETEWTVTLKETGEYLGEVNIPKIVDGYLGEVDYLFLREHWGKGFAYEAVTAMIEYAVETLNIKRFYAKIDNRHIKSKKLIEKLGFTLLAVLPESDFYGRVADVAYYARTT
jgi:RimJ/RimL family protein N-acetyltransferase